MFSRYNKILPKEKGFTLLEVMTAITILLLVILPLATLYVKSLTVIQNAALYSQAIQLAQERMDVCQALDYSDYYYYNEVFTIGFPYSDDPLPPAHQYDYYGNDMNPAAGIAYDNRDNPDTDGTELYFDPTDSDSEVYPVPVYRDYYNNYSGLCLDPNFNGLCDDDLDGDGDSGILGQPWDMDDIEIATNGRLAMYSDPEYGGTPAAALGNTYVPGDGLFDTVVEGRYVTSMDPMYRQIRITESSSPIIDVGLLLDRGHRVVGDFRHREVTFKGMVRMTTFLDPTPDLANPNDVDTWVDQLYFRDRKEIDGYSDEELLMLRLCLLRDLPIYSEFNTFGVGVADAGLDEWTEYNINYATPVYGTRVIVTVFYLTGEGEMELTDIDGDGVVEEVPIENYGGARRIKLERTFYNDLAIRGDIKQYAPPPRYKTSTEGANDANPVRSVLIPDVIDNGDDSDPCSLENNGLPYLN